MWLSESGQTTTISRGDERGDQQPRDRRAPDRRAGPATGRPRPATNGATHQTSSGRSSRMMAVSVRTESGTPSSSRAGRSSRVHTVDELANQARRRRQRVRARTRCATPRCGRCRPAGRTGASRSTTRCASRESSASVGSTAARRAASSSDGAIAISSDRSGALTNTRTRRRPHRRSSRTCRSRRPSTGSRPRSWRASPARRHGDEQRDGQQRRQFARSVARHARSASGVTAARPPDSPSRRACSRSGRTACRSRCRRARSCSSPAAS